MTRFERTALSVILYATTCGANVQGQNLVFRFSGPMLTELSELADTAHIEHFRCLLGVWRGDTLIIGAAYEPHVIAATALFISVGPCPPLLTRGEFHNHVPRNITAMGENLGQLWPLAAYCEMSSVDRKAEQRPNPPLLQMIAVAKGVSCLWVLVRGHYLRVPQWPP